MRHCHTAPSFPQAGNVDIVPPFFHRDGPQRVLAFCLTKPQMKPRARIKAGLSVFRSPATGIELLTGQIVEKAQPLHQPKTRVEPDDSLEPPNRSPVNKPVQIPSSHQSKTSKPPRETKAPIQGTCTQSSDASHALPAPFGSAPHSAKAFGELHPPYHKGKGGGLPHKRENGTINGILGVTLPIPF